MELEVEKKLKGIRDEAEMDLNEGRREAAMLEMSLIDTEEKMKETNGQLAGTAAQFANVLRAVECKEEEIRQTVEQAQERISEYKRRYTNLFVVYNNYTQSVMYSQDC
jgi:lipid II:glycine glycyltransferase (peptidoglycan interpeptide bridge formation enzyme)